VGADRSGSILVRPYYGFAPEMWPAVVWRTQPPPSSIRKRVQRLMRPGLGLVAITNAPNHEGPTGRPGPAHKGLSRTSFGGIAIERVNAGVGARGPSPTSRSGQGLLYLVVVHGNWG